MKKENLALLAEGHKLIALAYAREAGAEIELTETAVAPVVKADAPVVNEADNAPAEVEVDENAGYTEEELGAMTVKQLKEVASEIGIHIPKDTKKADIIDLILNADEEADEDEVEADEVDADEIEADEIEADEDGDDELTADDLEEMSLAELKELADEYEISYPKTVKAPALREILIEELFTDEEDEEEASDEGDEDGELTVEDLEEMSLAELKELADEYEVSYSKTVKAPALRKILVSELFDEEEAGDEDDSDETELDGTDYAEELGLNDMEVDELAEILAENGLPTKGKKQALIARIVEAIEDGTIEIEDEAGE